MEKIYIYHEVSHVIWDKGPTYMKSIKGHGNCKSTEVENMDKIHSLHRKQDSIDG